MRHSPLLIDLHRRPAEVDSSPRRPLSVGLVEWVRDQFSTGCDQQGDDSNNGRCSRCTVSPISNAKWTLLRLARVVCCHTYLKPRPCPIRNPLRDEMDQEDDSVQGHEQICEPASLTHRYSAPTSGGRPGSAVFVPDVRCAPQPQAWGVSDRPATT